MCGDMGHVWGTWGMCGEHKACIGNMGACMLNKDHV